VPTGPRLSQPTEIVSCPPQKHRAFPPDPAAAQRDGPLVLLDRHSPDDGKIERLPIDTGGRAAACNDASTCGEFDAAWELYRLEGSKAHGLNFLTGGDSDLVVGVFDFDGCISDDGCSIRGWSGFSTNSRPIRSTAPPAPASTLGCSCLPVYVTWPSGGGL